MKLLTFFLFSLALLFAGGGAYCSHLTYVRGAWVRNAFHRDLRYRPFATVGFCAGGVFTLLGMAAFGRAMSEAGEPEIQVIYRNLPDADQRDFGRVMPDDE